MAESLYATLLIKDNTPTIIRLIAYKFVFYIELRL